MTKCMLFVVLLISINAVCGGRRSSLRDGGNGGIHILPAKKKYSVKLGGTVCLPCQLNIPFNNKQYALRFWWRKKNKKKIFKNFPLDWPHFYSIENDCLRIVNISSLDHGTYKCTGIVLWKKHQSVSVSATRELIVVNRDVNATAQGRQTKIYPIIPGIWNKFDSSTKSPPLIKHVSTYLGQTVKLPCAVISFPISVVWYHGKRPVTSSPRVKIRKKKLALVIKSITRNDVGNYTCVAKGIMHRTSHNNMTYIVSVMSGASPSPTVVTWKKPSVTATYRRPAWNKLTVKIGDNVTLSCKAPKNEVHFLLWYVEGRPIKAGVVGYQTNHSIVKKLTLFNVSVENQYTCMAYPPRTDYKYPVQVVTLKFSTGNNVNKQDKVSSKHPALLLMIGVPVFAGLLSILIIVLCFRCHRKSISKTITLTVVDKGDEEDSLSMEILPEQPTGSLRKHQKLNSSTEIYPSLSKDHCINEYKSTVSSGHYNEEKSCLLKDLYINEEQATPERQQSEKPLDNSQCVLQHSSQKQFPVCDVVRNDQSNSGNTKKPKANIYTWPGQKLLPGDPDYIIFNETPIQTKKACQNRKKSESSDISNNEQKRSLQNTGKTDDCLHSGVIDDNIPELEIPEAPEEEDYLLKQEMKNWEPLIRHSSYSKNLEETISLLPTRCADEVNIIPDYPKAQIII